MRPGNCASPVHTTWEHKINASLRFVPYGSPGVGGGWKEELEWGDARTSAAYRMRQTGLAVTLWEADWKRYWLKITTLGPGS